MLASQLFAALRSSTAVQTGFLRSLEECELVIDGIARDKLSDLTTNVIRGHLAPYTRDQCTLFDIPIRSVAMLPCFARDAGAGIAATLICQSRIGDQTGLAL
jgi:hypothetical protein